MSKPPQRPRITPYEIRLPADYKRKRAPRTVDPKQPRLRSALEPDWAEWHYSSKKKRPFYAWEIDSVKKLIIFTLYAGKLKDFWALYDKNKLDEAMVMVGIDMSKFSELNPQGTMQDTPKSDGKLRKVEIKISLNNPGELWNVARSLKLSILDAQYHIREKARCSSSQVGSP